MAKVKNKRNSGLADKVHNKRKADANKKKLNPFEVHINKEKIKVLGKKSKHDRGLPGVSRAKAIQKRKETLGTEMKLMNKTNSFIDRRIGEKNNQLSAEDRMIARFAAERAKQHGKKNIYNLADDEILTHRGQTLEQIEKFDDPKSSDDEEDEGKKFGGLGDEFVSEGHFGGGILSKADSDGAKTHKDLIEQLIAESKKRKAEKQKEKEQTLDLTEKLDSEWKDLQPVVFKRPRIEENDSIIDKVLSQAEKKNADYDKMMRELKFDRRGTPSDGLKNDEKQAKEEKERLERMEKERQSRMYGEHEIDTPRVQQTTAKHRSADDLDDNFALDDEKEFMLAYDKDGKPLVPENVLKNFTVPNGKQKFEDGISDTSEEENDDSDEEESKNDEASDDEESNHQQDDQSDDESSDESDDSEDEDERNDQKKNDDVNDTNLNGDVNYSKDNKNVEIKNKDKKEHLKSKENLDKKEHSDKKNVQTKDKEKKDMEKVKDTNEGGLFQNSKSDDEVSDDDNGDAESGEESDDEDSSNDEQDDEKNDDLNDLKMSEDDDGSGDEVQADGDVTLFDLQADDGENLKELLSDKTPSQQSAAIQKLIKTHDPSLAEGNKDKLSHLFAHMLQYINDIFTDLQNEGDVIKAFLIFDKLAPHFYTLTQTNKVSTKKFIAQLLQEKHEKFKKNPRKVPDLDTLVFFKLVSLLYPTSDYRHPITTPSLVFMSEILTLSRFNSAYSISRGFFIVAMILEYTSLSKRLVPSAINFLRGILYLAANTSVLNPIQVVPPFRVHKDSKILNLEDNCFTVEVENKMAAKDLVSETIGNDFKIRSLLSCTMMLKEFFDYFNDMEAQYCLFKPHLELYSRIDLDLYPKKVGKTISETVKYFKECLEVKTFTPLTREKKKPKMLRLYEPDVQEVFTGSKSSKLPREQAERARLQNKIKKEMKGALREIRRDKSYIASVKIRQKIQSDNIRKAKVKQIYKDASIQQGELNKLKRMK